MTEETQAPARYETTRKLTSFARRHPLLTVFGVGGAALVGGLELAAGVVIGAGIGAMLRRPPPYEQPTAESPEHPHEGPMREKSRRMMARAHVIRERARAVVDAARGRQPGATVGGAAEPSAEQAPPPQPEQAPPPQPEPPRPEQPATD